jgi:hypothetical protein
LKWYVATTITLYKRGRAFPYRSGVNHQRGG